MNRGASKLYGTIQLGDESRDTNGQIIVSSSHAIYCQPRLWNKSEMK
jgi:hypothetical protein